MNYDNQIQTAYSQLQKGKPEQALDSLQTAKEVGQENGYDQTELDRLYVEANINSGNLVEAHRRANELLTADSEDACANELMGKVFLKDGQYDEAEKYFVKAQAGYESEVDISRAQDLVSLSRYFSAYEQGNLRLADRYLREIRDPDLQHVVDKAQKDIMAKGQ
jgi:tetratricopeptide (TPR) repeat protein